MLALAADGRAAPPSGAPALPRSPFFPVIFCGGRNACNAAGVCSGAVLILLLAPSFQDLPALVIYIFCVRSPVSSSLLSLQLRGGLARLSSDGLHRRPVSRRISRKRYCLYYPVAARMRGARGPSSRARSGRSSFMQRAKYLKKENCVYYSGCVVWAVKRKNFPACPWSVLLLQLLFLELITPCRARQGGGVFLQVKNRARL